MQRVARRLVLLGVAAVASYGIAASVRSAPLYEYAKSRGRDFEGTLHRPDATLGFAHIPDARGQMLFPVGEPLATRYDADGFRVPEGEANRERHRPLVLALGDSCTYGDACRAEDAYPHRLAEILGGSEVNAGVCGYGLAQIAIVAQRTIPRFRPDVVVVQYSPWLVSRARSNLAPAYYETIAAPFLFDTPDGLASYPPLGATLGAALPVAALSGYRDTPRGLLDRLSFVLRAGIPRVVRGDLVLLAYAVARALGRVPEPASEEDIVSHVYGDIAELCRAYGARMVVLILGNGESRVRIPDALAALGLTVVDGDAALFARLGQEEDAEAYRRAYAHYRGSPPRLVDTHPNPQAHAILAGEIAAALGSQKPPDGEGADRRAGSGG